jgi:hypothetical protein
MIPIPTDPPPFTARQLGAALGKSTRAILLAMRGVPPDTHVANPLTRGQLAPAWRLESLPSRLVSALGAMAAQRGCRDAAHLLAGPPARWEPPVPLPQVAPAHIERAAKLQRALRRGLELSADDSREDGERARIGFEHFRREYGPASERHYRRLLQRTIDRAGGEPRWDDLALYLDERPARKAGAAPMARTDSDRAILDYTSDVQDPLHPTRKEAALVWVVACEQLHARIEAGKKEKAARRDIAALLIGSGVSLGRNADAVKESLKRKFAQWLAGGRTLSALEDLRPLASGYFRAPKLSQEDRLTLIAHTRLNCGGRESQSWRELRERGELSDDLMTHYRDDPVSKSYVPARIRDAITGDVKRMKNFHHGPREHKLKGAFHTRDWRAVAAGDWYQADDVTPPIYYWHRDERGAVEILRGQFLPMVDERTTCVLGFVLISEPNYNSLAIRSLITNVCGEHGLPRHGFSFERGIWKSSRILTGGKNAVPFAVADAGLRGLGLRFRHAQLPRGKVIERTIGQLQDMMEGVRGYTGRDERRDGFERLQRAKLDVEAGRVAADERFLSEAQIAAEFLDIIERYNHAPQQGRKLPPGWTPMQGWEQLQGAPRAMMDARCLHLLAHDRRKVKVGANGITIQIGKQRFNYKDRETGARVGEEVLAWFNPQRPDLLPCTDLAQREVFTVQRSCEIPAVGATREQLARENGLIAAHQGYASELYRVIKNTLPPVHYRRNLVDGKTERVGEQIAAQRTAITVQQREENNRAATLARKARRAGIPAGLVSAEVSTELAGRSLDTLRTLLGAESTEESHE